MVNYKKLGKLLIWRCKQKKVGSQLPTATMAEIEETEPAPSILLPCASCSRTFRPEALAKHSKVCEKVLMKKRKQFDSSKQRLQGTEIESFVIPSVTKTPRKREQNLNLSKSKWKEKVELARTMQAAKKSIESSLSAQIKPSDHEECPHCGRTFGPKAFERHTEFCKEQQQKLKLSNNVNNSEAKERLKVRTTYRGPLTYKVLNRDRYQPNKNRDPSPLGLKCSESLDEVNKSRGLSRHSSLRSSLRSKPETTPPPPLRRTATLINPSTRGTRGITKDISDIDTPQKTPATNNRPKMISKEPIEKRMKPTNSKTVPDLSEVPASSKQKTLLKLNNIDVNTFKELSVISCMNHEPPLVENQYFKPINSHEPSYKPRESLIPRPTFNLGKVHNEDILYAKPATELDYTLQAQVKSDINTTPIEKKTDSSMRCNKNQAFTVEFEPDNRFVVYEHYKAGLSKSPVIFKKRISNYFETLKSLDDKQVETEEVVVDNYPVSSNKETQTRKHIPKTQSDTQILNSSYSLSWRERVLEMMDSNDSPCFSTHVSNFEPQTNATNVIGNRDLKTNPKSAVKSNFEINGKNIEAEVFDKSTDIDHLSGPDHSSIEQELSAIFSAEKAHKNLAGILPSIKIVNAEIAGRPSSLTDASIQQAVLPNSPVNFIPGSKFEGITNPLQSTECSELTHTQINKQEALQSQNFLDASIYFIEESNITKKVLKEEMDNALNFIPSPKCQSITDPMESTECSQLTHTLFNNQEALQSHNILDASIYFIEENNITKKVLQEEMAVIDNEYEKKEAPNETNLSTRNTAEQEYCGNSSIDLIGYVNDLEAHMSNPNKEELKETISNDLAAAGGKTSPWNLLSGSSQDNKPIILGEGKINKLNQLLHNNSKGPQLVSDISLFCEYQLDLFSRNQDFDSGFPPELFYKSDTYDDTVEAFAPVSPISLFQQSDTHRFVDECSEDNTPRNKYKSSFQNEDIHPSPLQIKLGLHQSLGKNCKPDNIIEEKKYISDSISEEEEKSSVHNIIKEEEKFDRDSITKEEEIYAFTSINKEVDMCAIDSITEEKEWYVVTSLNKEEEKCTIIDSITNEEEKIDVDSITKEEETYAVTSITKGEEKYISDSISEEEEKSSVHNIIKEEEKFDRDSITKEEEMYAFTNINKQVDKCAIDNITKENEWYAVTSFNREKEKYTIDSITNEEEKADIDSITKEEETYAVHNIIKEEEKFDRDSITKEEEMYAFTNINKEVDKCAIDNITKENEWYAVTSFNKEKEKCTIDSITNEEEKVDIDSITKEGETYPVTSLNKERETYAVTSLNKEGEKCAIDSITKGEENFVIGGLNNDNVKDNQVVNNNSKEEQNSVINSFNKVKENHVVDSNRGEKENYIIDSFNNVEQKHVSNNITKEEGKYIFGNINKKEEKCAIGSITKVDNISYQEVAESDCLIEEFSTEVKDEILKLAGQEFVSMANEKNECYYSHSDPEKSRIKCNSDTSYKYSTNAGALSRNGPYNNTYKPYTYCQNAHVNNSQEADENYFDFFSHLKNYPEKVEKVTTLEELSSSSNRSANCDSSVEADCFSPRSTEEQYGDDHYHFFQLGRGSETPCATEFCRACHDGHSSKIPIISGNFPFDISNYRSGKSKSSMDETPASSQRSFSTNYSTPIKSATSATFSPIDPLNRTEYVPLQRSKYHNNHKSCTLPPINKNNQKSEIQSRQEKIEKMGNRGHSSNFFQHYVHLKQDNNALFSNDSDKESITDSDWDLTDSDTFYEEKSTVFSHSSKTVYNNYYEQVKYLQDSNEFKTVKTSVYQLPFSNPEHFKDEEEIKLPAIKLKRFPQCSTATTSKNSHHPTTAKEKIKSHQKLPPLRNFRDCKWCFPHVVRHVITTVLPKRFSIQDAEKYNPYLSAERQMLELFGTDESKGKNILPDIHRSSPIQSSPISAFVKYSSPKRASSVESLKSDNKENNNADTEIIDFPPVDQKMDNRKHFSLSNLSLCSVVSIDSIDCNKNSFNSKLCDNHLDDLQRTFTVVESKSNRGYSKPKVNLQQMLYGPQSPDQTEQTPHNESSNSNIGNLEACEAELLISMLEFEKMLKSSPSPPSSHETSPNLCSSSAQKRQDDELDTENRNEKNLNNSIDSAYSSLTRSSGADAETGKMEMSKFCHECGAKYPIAGAKFCCNCGMRRISL